MSTEVKTDSSQTKAYNILKDTASKTQNVRLAMLASKVYAGPPARAAEEFPSFRRLDFDSLMRRAKRQPTKTRDLWIETTIVSTR